MNFFKRALLSIKRKLGKTAILFVIVFILGNIIAGAIAVQQATTNVEQNVKSKLGATATIDVDYEAWNKLAQEQGEGLAWPKGPSVEVIDAVGALDMVKYYDYSAFGSLKSHELKRVIVDDKMVFEEGDLPYFMLSGVQHPQIIDVEEGKAKLVEGRVFTEDDIKGKKKVAVIAKQLAEENDLSVGSTMKFLNQVEDWYAMKDSGRSSERPDALAEHEVEIEIIGIIDPVLIESKKNNNQGYDENAWKNEEAMNKIYLPNEVVNEENDFTQNTMLEAHPEMAEEEQGKYFGSRDYQAAYVLKSPDDVETFRVAAQPLLPELYIVVASSDTYDQISGSMKTMQNLSKMVLIVAIIATLLIITLLIILFIRDRKHEFGIYLSLGEKKAKVVGQIVIEVVLISFVAMSLSLVTGNILAQGVSSSMIQNQLENSEDGMSGAVYYSSLMGSSDMTEEEVVENYEVKITLSYVVVFYAVGLLTIIGATVVPTLYLLRLNPKKIMM